MKKILLITIAVPVFRCSKDKEMTNPGAETLKKEKIAGFEFKNIALSSGCANFPFMDSKERS